MGLVDDGQVPLGVADVRRFGLGKLVRADDDFVGVEGIEVTGFDGRIETLGLQNDGRKEEFLQQLAGPLFPEVGRANNQEAAFMFRPVLGEDDTGLDSFAKAHFVSQDGALGER